MKTQRHKVLDWTELSARINEARRTGKKIVFTNGCFDVLHAGHIRLLKQARQEGDLLVVAINSDASVRTLNKGPDRPIHPQEERAEVLAAFAAVDFVVVFDQSTPLELIETVRPDILAKGGDWGENQIVGREVVESYGGKVVRFPVVPGKSTTSLVGKIRNGE